MLSCLCSISLLFLSLTPRKNRRQKNRELREEDIPFGVSNTNLISALLVNGTASWGSLSNFRIPIVVFSSSSNQTSLGIVDEDAETEGWRDEWQRISNCSSMRMWWWWCVFCFSMREKQKLWWGFCTGQGYLYSHDFRTSFSGYSTVAGGFCLLLYLSRLVGELWQAHRCCVG
jgi:hypothetical protein